MKHTMSYKSMDWFSWLSKTGLEPSLVYEYGLAFDHNELEEADIAYFNHEFLQSMGISIAKHRLEILKLARKQAGGKPRPLLLLITAVKKTKKCLRNYIERWVYRSEDSSALVVVPRSNYNSRWKLKKNRRPTMLTQGRLLLTNGSSKVVARTSLSTGTSPSLFNICNRDKVEDDDSYWGVEEIKWDTMFQDVKPT